jgi:hypothetical protein
VPEFRVDCSELGRDFAAWLGLVPKQISTGDRTILGKVSRRGNRYLRVLFVQAAWVVLIKPKIWERRAQALARGGQETAASQRAGNRPRQQARPHRLARSGSWPGLRGAEDQSRRSTKLWRKMSSPTANFRLFDNL